MYQLIDYYGIFRQGIKYLFKGPGECGIIFKAALIAGLGHAASLSNEILCQQKSLLCYVITDCITGFRFKIMHKVISAEIEILGYLVNGYILGKMLVNIVNYLKKLAVLI